MRTPTTPEPEPPRYRVTIEKRGKDADVPIASGQHEDDLAWALYYAIRGAGEARPDQITANLVDHLQGWEELCRVPSDHEVFPGYWAALNQFIDAARKLKEGWRQHDKAEEQSQ